MFLQKEKKINKKINHTYTHTHTAHKFDSQCFALVFLSIFQIHFIAAAGGWKYDDERRTTTET